jgi:crotonobetaine/carnitine-CoA ligase
VRFEDSTRSRYADCAAAALGAGEALRRAGIGPGDHLAIALPSGPDFLRAWWGATVIGAAVVPVNLAYRGDLLAHLLRLSKPAAIVSTDSAKEQPRCEY